jgi:hypothetical protein
MGDFFPLSLPAWAVAICNFMFLLFYAHPSKMSIIMAHHSTN